MEEINKNIAYSKLRSKYKTLLSMYNKLLSDSYKQENYIKSLEYKVKYLERVVQNLSEDFE